MCVCLFVLCFVGYAHSERKFTIYGKATRSKNIAIHIKYACLCSSSTIIAYIYLKVMLVVFILFGSTMHSNRNVINKCVVIISQNVCIYINGMDSDICMEKIVVVWK